MPAKGHRKGIPNIIPQEVKQSVMSVYNALGSADGLLKWARKNQTEYYRMLVAILPKEQKIEFVNPMTNIRAEDLAKLIIAIGRNRGIAIPSYVERIAGEEAGIIQALPQAETISQPRKDA